LFSSREAYGDPGDAEGWDLRKKFRDDWGGPKYKVWWTVGRWAHAAFRISNKQTAPFPLDVGEIQCAFLSTAIVNIKKSGGTSSTKFDNLRSYFNEDRALIRRQLDLINPEIVVCGNLGRTILESLWPGLTAVQGRVSELDGLSIIDFAHPANRRSNAQNYSEMCDLLEVAIRRLD